ncbi:28S ribosomal protein S27, mitochondrial [Trachymyrmex septentrionalis]|uniref:28S ribosomal protein S27, mitochondrial n=1 Tax=Trachymyrmex septentrionalis TaxID=34720 RepID=A0A195FB75_9HYME|nr:PREDICTED: 28S ribosomal protein S27, mitochondrial-like [Trachymyrmex septentrionalis]KYN37289.1 28S ribosomal protein S27, mitochondrial [Trachymyrmex septentrionalis]
MLKTFRLSHRLCRVHRSFKDSVTRVQRRLFLSEAYRCEEAWSRRLESPLLQKIEPASMYIQLEQKYGSIGKVSAVDVDIFVNSVSDNLYVNEVIKILHNLRQSVETTNILDSTHHAVIRYFLQHNYIQELLEVLTDRLNYGIFPDYFDYNILMDHFINRKDYTSAAKVASLVMLQEDAGHPITNALCLYACHRYLENPDEWKKPEVPVDTSEEVKVRVQYLRNPYFDDHFDLTDPKDLVGKTLNFQGKHRADAIGRSCQLRGLILYKKYDDVLNLIKKWLEMKQDKIVYEEVFELISKDNNGFQDQDAEKFKLVEAQLSILKEKQNLKESFIEAIENLIKVAINEETEKDISKQYQAYLDWEHKRTSVLEAQMKEIDRERRIDNIKKIKEDLEKREQFLTFFDKEEEIELKIEQIQEKERKQDERVRAMHNSAKHLRKLITAESYIPPDVKSKK